MGLASMAMSSVDIVVRNDCVDSQQLDTHQRMLMVQGLDLTECDESRIDANPGFSFHLLILSDVSLRLRAKSHTKHEEPKCTFVSQ